MTHGCDVMTAGSPWRVNVSSPAQISMTGAGLKSVPVHKPTTFEVRTGLSHDYGNLVANILCEYIRHDDVCYSSITRLIVLKPCVSLAVTTSARFIRCTSFVDAFRSLTVGRFVLQRPPAELCRHASPTTTTAASPSSTHPPKSVSRTTRTCTCMLLG